MNLIFYIHRSHTKKNRSVPLVVQKNLCLARRGEKTQAAGKVTAMYADDSWNFATSNKDHVRTTCFSCTCVTTIIKRKRHQKVLSTGFITQPCCLVCYGWKNEHTSDLLLSRHICFSSCSSRGYTERTNLSWAASVCCSQVHFCHPWPRCILDWKRRYIHRLQNS